MPGENASMAMKCVAQMPNPVAVAETISQTWRIWSVALRTWCSKVTAVNDASRQTAAASTTSRRSCAFTTQL